MKRLKSTLVLLAGMSMLAPAQIVEKKSLNMDGARRVIAAAVSEAHNKKTTGVIAVVDDGGNLMALERIDGTFAAGQIYRSERPARRCCSRNRQSFSKMW